VDTPDNIPSQTEVSQAVAQAQTGSASTPRNDYILPPLRVSKPFLSGTWSHPIFGYLAAILLQLIVILGILALTQLYPAFRFPVILEEEGFEVTTTDKGEYLEKLRNGGLPHIILLDVLLSGKDGRDIVRYLKSQEETRHIPVIMLSAHPSASETARQAGADEFIAKPFDIDELLAIITKFV